GLVISKSTYTIGGVDFICNGSTVGSFAGNGLKPSYTDPIFGSDQNITFQLVKVTGLTAAAGTSGAKTLRIANSGGGNIFVSGIVVPSATPPRVFVAKEPPRGSPPEAQWTSAHAWYDSEIATIVSEFDNAHLVDLQTDFDSTMYVDSATDGQGIHPNDKGHWFIANKFTESINTNITDWDEGIVSLS
ncbi:hypothetical protein KDA23_05700, partial [Candidatus Saccharibacteria bacterium]|nr:hypothetical protein [Candidatus Saccharibacteria bacterium]